MINSILNRHTDPVILHNIKTESEIITDPSTILSHIQQHFYQWTKHQPYQTETFNQYWANEYHPKATINMNWYAPLLQPITTEETLHTIKQLPNKKACGPLGISYDMLKHCGPHMLHAITHLLNKCLNTNNILKQ